MSFTKDSCPTLLLALAVPLPQIKGTRASLGLYLMRKKHLCLRRLGGKRTYACPIAAVCSAAEAAALILAEDHMKPHQPTQANRIASMSSAGGEFANMIRCPRVLDNNFEPGMNHAIEI